MAQRSRSLTRRVTWLVMVAIAAVVLAVLMRSSPVPVDVATIQRGPLRVTLAEEGETRVADRFVVSAPLAGRVLRLELRPGDPVVANRTIVARLLAAAPALIDARTRAELSARVQSAEATLARARAELARVRAESAQAERVHARSQALAKAGAIAQERLEAEALAAQTLRNAEASADASVRAAESDLQMARASLMPSQTGARQSAPIELRSPIDGVVLRRVRESEAVVAQGEPLIEIGDISRLEVVADFLSSDAVLVAAGQPAVIERWGGGNSLRARVRLVEPSGFTKISALGVEEQRVNVVLDVEDPREAWTRLGDRYRVEVQVVIWEAADVVLAPGSSLVRQGAGWAVFVVEGDVARVRPVTAGQRNDSHVQILTGVEPGTRVVVYPGDAVADGERVEVSAAPRRQ